MRYVVFTREKATRTFDRDAAEREYYREEQTRTYDRDKIIRVFEREGLQ